MAVPIFGGHLSQLVLCNSIVLQAEDVLNDIPHICLVYSNIWHRWVRRLKPRCKGNSGHPGHIGHILETRGLWQW
jgi:hypothetical protein